MNSLCETENAMTTLESDCSNQSWLTREVSIKVRSHVAENTHASQVEIYCITYHAIFH